MSASEECIKELRKHCKKVNEMNKENEMVKRMVLTKEIEKGVENLIKEMDKKLKNIGFKELTEITENFNKELQRLIKKCKD